MNDCVHLPGRLQGTGCLENRDGGPVTCNAWFGSVSRLPRSKILLKLPLQMGHLDRSALDRWQPALKRIGKQLGKPHLQALSLFRGFSPVAERILATKVLPLGAQVAVNTQPRVEQTIDDVV